MAVGADVQRLKLALPLEEQRSLTSNLEANNERET